MHLQDINQRTTSSRNSINMSSSHLQHTSQAPTFTRSLAPTPESGDRSGLLTKPPRLGSLRHDSAVCRSLVLTIARLRRRNKTPACQAQTLSQPHRGKKEQLIYKSRVSQLKKEHALRHILQRPPPQPSAQDSERERKMRVANVPVYLKIEHCGYQRSAVDGLRIGKALRAVTKEMFVQTLHAPLQGIEGTTYEQVCEQIKEIYQREFTAMHHGHVHPSRQDGEIITGDLRLVPFPGCSERIFGKNGWQEALMILALSQRYHPLLDQDVRQKHKTATFVMSFTCPRVG